MKYSEENLLTFYTQLAQSAGVEIVEMPHFKYLYVPNTAYPKVIFQPHFEAENAISVIENIRQKQAQGFPNIVVCSPIVTSQDTISALRSHAKSSNQWAAMSLDLEELPVLQNRNSIEIKRISSFSDIQEWCRVVEMGLLGGKQMKKDMFIQMSKIRNTYLFSAFNNQETVATAMAIVKNKTVGIYLIATLESHRRQGIGRYITHFALQKAKEQGAKIAHLQATALGESVYQKIGFQKMVDIPVFRV